MVQICHLDTRRHRGDPDMTSGLLKLRKWLALPEAADYLSSTIRHNVEEGDIVRLALDGELQLSVNLLEPMAAIQDSEGAKLSEHRENIEGVWDLLLKGPVRLELQKRYRTMCGPPYVELDTREGAFVTGKKGVVYQLALPPFLKRVSDPNLSVLPVGTVLGVRRQVLDAAVASFALHSPGPEGQQPSKSAAADPLDRLLRKRERATLLTIIAALARAADIDISKASKAGAIIEAQIDQLGARVSGRTIEIHLKRIPDALERNSKTSH